MYSLILPSFLEKQLTVSHQDFLPGNVTMFFYCYFYHQQNPEEKKEIRSRKKKK